MGLGGGVYFELAAFEIQSTILGGLDRGRGSLCEIMSVF